MNQQDFVYDQVYKGICRAGGYEPYAKDEAARVLEVYKKNSFSTKVSKLIEDGIDAGVNRSKKNMKFKKK